MVISIMLLSIYLVLFIISGREALLEDECKDKVLIPFYKISYLILNKIYSSKKLKKKIIRSMTVDNLSTLNPKQNNDRYIVKYYIFKLTITLFIIFCGSVLGLIVSITELSDDTIIDGEYLKRGDYNDSQTEQNLTISIEDKLENKDITINIEQRNYTQEEIQVIFKTIEEKLPEAILNKNSSLDEIRSNLNLITGVNDYPVSISWKVSDYSLVDSTGTISNENMTEDSAEIVFTAILSYKDYETEYEIKGKILPPLLTTEEIIINKIMNEVVKSNESTITNEYFKLPSTVDNMSIVWNGKKNNSSIIIIILSLIAGILIYQGKDKELNQKIIDRNKQLICDYPDIVSKFTLLLGAGMTVKSAWTKIVLDYRDKENKDAKKHYAYEEMLITYYEIQSGISEIKAYEDFGKRCKNQRYLKMSAIITQNLRKGSAGLSKILEGESLEAFEDRKSLAKIAGEEAGTKLLIPMFLMLIIVMAIIMIPAFMTF